MEFLQPQKHHRRGGLYIPQTLLGHVEANLAFAHPQQPDVPRYAPLHKANQESLAIKITTLVTARQGASHTWPVAFFHCWPFPLPAPFSHFSSLFKFPRNNTYGWATYHHLAWTPSLENSTGLNPSLRTLPAAPSPLQSKMTCLFSVLKL